MTVSKSDLPHGIPAPGAATPPPELRSAVRFPINLSAVLTAADKDLAATTRNISACGVLFDLGQELQPGSAIKFSLTMPGAALSAAHDILVLCAGRVVRCSISQDRFLAAATIDEYRYADS